MPHLVNYLHGAIHYNGVYIIFNDFEDGICHFRDPRFRDDIMRLAAEEKREIMIVFREREYSPEEYAHYFGFIHSHFPFFSNVNGNQRRVLFGNPAPYPTSNMITGYWLADFYKLYRGDSDSIVREPVRQGQYFTGVYQGDRRAANKLEIFYAWVWNKMVEMRNFRGGLVFTDRNRIEPERRRAYDEEFDRTGQRPRMVARVRGPFTYRAEEDQK
jgi:hypothetical protein